MFGKEQIELIKKQLITTFSEADKQCFAILKSDLNFKFRNRYFHSFLPKKSPPGFVNCIDFRFQNIVKSSLSLCMQYPLEAISAESRLSKEAGGQWINWEFVGILNEKEVEVFCVGQPIKVKQSLLANFENYFEKLEKIIDSITDGFLIVDKRLRVTNLNSALIKITGKTRQEIHLNSIENAFPWKPSEEMIRHLQLSQKEQHAMHFEEFYAQLDLWLEVSIYPFSEGSIIYLRDISNRKKVESQLVKQNEQLIEISRYYSHEIRRPVASILGIVNLIDKNALGEVNRELLNYLEKTTLELDRTIKKIVHKTY